MIIVIGRGHSGTRAISHTLYASGVYMGRLLNRSGDKVPPDQMYEACRVLAEYVTWHGEFSWDFSQLHDGRIDRRFESLIEEYLGDTLSDDAEHKGWKIPETTLAYPWIARTFPEAKYIQWIRDPRDSIISHHTTDDLRDFGISYPETDDLRERRAISWYYQYQMMKATPDPANVITVRFEDFVLNQEETLQRLEEFLGFELARIVVREDSVGRWKTDPEQSHFDFLDEPMEEQGYTSRQGG
jgi:hypothetical protein